jgi:hypothetical protein
VQWTRPEEGEDLYALRNRSQCGVIVARIAFAAWGEGKDRRGHVLAQPHWRSVKYECGCRVAPSPPPPSPPPPPPPPYRVHNIQLLFSANMPMPPLNHIPSLFLATTFTFGGMLPIFAPARAMHEFGLPAHIIASPEAQSVFNVYSSRMTAFGLAIYAFHWKGMYEAVDIVLMTMAYATVVDAWICWKENAPGSAAFRGISGLVVAGLRLWGITAW